MQVFPELKDFGVCNAPFLHTNLVDPLETWSTKVFFFLRPGGVNASIAGSPRGRGGVPDVSVSKVNGWAGGYHIGIARFSKRLRA